MVLTRLKLLSNLTLTYFNAIHSQQVYEATYAICDGIWSYHYACFRAGSI